MAVGMDSSMTRIPDFPPSGTSRSVSQGDKAPLSSVKESSLSERTNEIAKSPMSELTVSEKQEKAHDVSSPHTSPLQGHITPPPRDARRLSFVSKNGRVELLIAPKSATVIPTDAHSKIHSWLENHKTALSAQSERIPYHKDDIPGALKEFQDKYHCSWHEMKNHCKEPQVLQIINDMRAAYLEEIFGELRKEFAGDLKNIADFGSSKLTSDRDFAFQVSPDKQAKEIVIVKRFNELFESKWRAKGGGGVPSAVVFDSNAYTMQYLMTANNPRYEEARSKLQQEGSLLMKLRNANPASWVSFKSATLANMSPGSVKTAKEREFTKVEKRDSELQTLLHREIVRMGSTLLSGEEVDPETLNAEQLLSAATAIKNGNPQIEIQASNTLHERLKTASKSLEDQRAGLQIALATLDRSSDSKKTEEFVLVFNSRVKQLVVKMREEAATTKDPAVKSELESQMAKLSSQEITGGEEEEVMSAYQAQSKIQQEEHRLHQDRVALEGDFNRFQDLNSQLEGLKYKTDSVSSETSIKELNSLSVQSKKMHEEVAQYQTKFGGTDPKSTLQKIGERTKDLDTQLKLTAGKKRELENIHGEAWGKAGILRLESDRLLVRLQEANLTGMCFAAEAHISEGAFAVVVLNIQSGKSDVRTVNQYVQAFREIGGFYSGHQVHQPSSHGKIVEASKYAERLMFVTKMIENRVKALGIPAPVANVNVEGLNTFFKTVAPLRGSTKSDDEVLRVVDSAARSSKLIDSKNSFNKESLDGINNQIEQLGASLEAWVSALPENECNAYYRATA